MIQPTRRQWLSGVAASATLLSGGYGWSRYRQAIASAQRRLVGRSSTLMTPSGTLEYAVARSGPPLLMIHGTGGGFDQGLHFAAALGRRGHRIIAPSRFGYLRSSFPADPSVENQADAFIPMLDRLGIDRLPVVGGSAGALSATAFALRYPERCSMLILLVPAANVSGEDPVAMTALQQVAVRSLLNSDFLYWSALNLAPDSLVGTLLATDPLLLSSVGPSERRRAMAILSDMLPIHARARGTLNDAEQAGNPAQMSFARLSMPVLLISVEDDRFGTAATARRIAEVVPQAELTIFPTGGHVWLGHNEEIADRMHIFISRVRSAVKPCGNATTAAAAAAALRR